MLLLANRVIPFGVNYLFLLGQSEKMVNITIVFCVFSTIYWTDWVSQPKIELASMDDGQRMTIANVLAKWTGH